MSLEELQDQQSRIVIQRSQAKDIVEQSEVALGQIGFAIQALQSEEEARKKALTDAGVIED